MPIPDFQSVMLPLLRHLEDGQERRNQETLDALAREFGLDDEEREELLPSGRQAVFTNRVAWAKAHLKAAELIESPRRGVYKIAPRGLELLSQNPARVDLRLLRSFPEYQQWRTPKPDGGADPATESPASLKAEDALTPEEHLEYGYQKVRDDVAAELLRRVKESSPAFFERLVVELLVAMGYGGSRGDAGRTLGRSGDGGVDGVIKEDRLASTSSTFRQSAGTQRSGDPRCRSLRAPSKGREPRRASSSPPQTSRRTQRTMWPASTAESSSSMALGSRR